MGKKKNEAKPKQTLSEACKRLLAEVEAIDWGAFAEDEDQLEQYPDLPDAFLALIHNNDCSSGMRRLWDTARIDIAYAGMFCDTHVLLIGFLLRLLPLDECLDPDGILRWLGSLGVIGCDPAENDPPNRASRTLLEGRPIIARFLHHPDLGVRGVAVAVLLRLSVSDDYRMPPMPEVGPVGRDVLQTLAEIVDDDKWRAIMLTHFRFFGTAEHVPDLIHLFLEPKSTSSIQLAAAVVAAHLAGPSAPAEVVNHLRSALVNATYERCNYGFTIKTKQIPGWVRKAVWQLGPDAALPILIEAMKSPKASSIAAVDAAIGFLGPWHGKKPRIYWSTNSKATLTGLTPPQRTFLAAFADFPWEQKPQVDWAQELTTKLKNWGLPTDPDKLRAKLAKIPAAKPVAKEPPPPAPVVESAPPPPLAPSAEAVAFHQQIARMKGFDWLTSTDPDALLTWMRQLEGPWTNDRRSHLFAVACCRRLGDHLTTAGAKTILDLVEVIVDDPNQESRSEKKEQLRSQKLGGGFRPPDGTADQVVQALYVALYSPRGFIRWFRTLEVLGVLAAGVREFVGAEEARTQAQFLRCIYGHPPTVPAFEPQWRTPTATALARRAYDDREYGVLPILADALEDAGCTDATVLHHCRAPGPHTRGCWCVDLVLG